jgi:hypothetical protein
MTEGKQQAHLFLCLSNGHYAVSADKAGGNLPLTECAEGWKYIKPITVGVQQPLVIGMDPEPVLRALLDVGFYISEPSSQPHGTAQ